jgi:8-oxo-dGTP pyrophosphatase MutT (NUDIX family)
MSIEPNDIQAALQKHQRQEYPALPGRTNHLKTGVLVPLIWSPEPMVVLTLRAANLRSHAGEVSFPGGKPDAQDVNLEATALREASEELGIYNARVLGRLSSLPLYTSEYRLEPYVAEVTDQRPFTHNEEVEQVLYLTLREVLSRPSIDGLPYVLDGKEVLSPLFFPGGHAMFGATAYCFLELLVVCAPLFELLLPPLIAGAHSWEEVLGRR